jgi:hypothetical protein
MQLDLSQQAVVDDLRLKMLKLIDAMGVNDAAGMIVLCAMADSFRKHLDDNGQQNERAVFEVGVHAVTAILNLDQ